MFSLPFHFFLNEISIKKRSVAKQKLTLLPSVVSFSIVSFYPRLFWLLLTDTFFHVTVNTVVKQRSASILMQQHAARPAFVNLIHFEHRMHSIYNAPCFQGLLHHSLNQNRYRFLKASIQRRAMLALQFTECYRTVYVHVLTRNLVQQGIIVYGRGGVGVADL